MSLVEQLMIFGSSRLFCRGDLQGFVRTKAIQNGLRDIHAHDFGAVAINEFACELRDVDPRYCEGEQTAFAQMQANNAA